MYKTSMSYYFRLITVFSLCCYECWTESNRPESKRLLISQNCFPPISYCHLNCAYGLRKGYNGCPLCQCAPRPSSQSSTSTNTATFQGGSAGMLFGFGNSQLSAFYNPCLPQQRFCLLQCQYGYLTGNNGCQFCFCAKPLQTTTSPTSTQGPSVPLQNPCLVSQKDCSKTCKYGYLKGPGNCNYCICAPDNLQIVTSTTTVATTTTANTIQNPCIQGQTTCSMRCQSGLLRGPRGCEYCLCAPDVVTTVTTPASSTHTHKPLDNHDVHFTTSATPTSSVSPDVKNECIIATTICQLKCKGGFMIDPQHCTFCVCKDQVYNQTGILKADEPVIELMSPCVEGLNICRIFCAEGYLRGPKNCQYCACRH